MDLTDRALLYKIVRARDKRYDGRFYCAVRTTGIYCRPICPARPKLENMTFYRSATEAENAGFRACLRCRPDLAPHSAQWDGTAAIVGRALSLISRGEADSASLSGLAEKLGVTDRHLRRLFEAHLGASPIEVAASKRLHLARHLLEASNLRVVEVAYASGYRSLRRFNEAFKEKFRVPPSSLREKGARKHGAEPGFIEIELPVIAPFDWDAVYDFLERHRQVGIESFADGKYRRGFLTREGVSGGIEVEYDRKRERLRARVSISDPSCLRAIVEQLRDLFDIRTNPHAHRGDLDAQGDAIAAGYLDALGLRIPGAWDPYETAVGIILGQLVSLEQARTKVKRLVDQFGRRVPTPVFADCTHLFPRAEVLAGSDLQSLGITKVREQAIRELSRQVAQGELDLSRSADIRETRAKLLSIRGIGPWTVEMIAMRCLGDSNAFPKTDLIIQRALELHEMEKGDWSPWNAYIALALWKKYAAELSRKSSSRR